MPLTCCSAAPSAFFPHAIIRAYAGDLAVVTDRVLADLPFPEATFDEYARVSGLRLHLGKSILLPLSVVEARTFRAAVSRVAPSWGAMRVGSHAEYLGFATGPS